MAFSFNATFPEQLLLISKSQISKSAIFEVVLVCDFTFFSKFSTRKKVQSSFCHKGLSHFPYGVQLGLTHCDQKEPKSNLVFGLGSFRLVDAFGLSSTQVESGAQNCPKV